ncbi:hypothetical protein SDRG_15482 [Saprolegnia diclina VS20]|uniref:Uncharacterized protein n=1 Tax=Saprolegnia diclina (strain VS20) TaxID=1156394 RepID=T0RAU6_SAPDV|nr:hypothetical protein SDRG_15482 [Saprolegnia diclina VS20]EQC26697.1 hypothetical protein SDRG_15482 [Saprolegnia diclina VS20]|eukprot:XP_008619879.1 hypothetical protein SDRG_15482 [Saprolegnia diclina VS20]
MAFQRKPRSEWEPLFCTTLATALTHLGETHPTTLATRGSFAFALAHDDAFAEALPLALDEFNVRRSIDGLGNVRTAKAAALIGHLYSCLLQPTVASRWLRKAYMTQVTCLGPEHKATLTTLSQLAVARMRVGAPSQARPLWATILSSYERAFGADHINTLLMRLQLATTMMMDGDAQLATSALLSLKTAFEARNDLYFLTAVHLNLGATHQHLGKTDDALAYFGRALRDMPSKVSAWALYHMAVHAGAPATDSLRLVRDYVVASDEDAPETWPLCCMVCHTPIVGCVVACAKCPQAIFTFCGRCYAQRPSRLTRFCRHDSSETEWTRTLPPRRFFYKEDLLATESTVYADTEDLWGEYEAYCHTHKVPTSERLPRTSVPGLSRGWHPML